MIKSNKSKTRRRELNDKKRDTRKMTFAFKTDLANSFVELAEKLGYNNTEALELLMQKAIEGLLPRKTVWDISGQTVLKVNELFFNPEWEMKVNKYITEIEQHMKEIQSKQEELFKAGDVIETQRGKIAVEAVDDQRTTFRFRK